MIVDGKQLAEDIYIDIQKTVAQLSRAPHMTAITCAPNFETQKYLELKKRKAKDVGIQLNVIELPADSSTEDVVSCIEKITPTTDGIVVQLPLPKHIDREVVLSAVPMDKDPDGFQYSDEVNSCLPPVVGAIEHIAKLHTVEWNSRQVVVVGNGRLVGAPAAVFAKRQGAQVTIVTEASLNIEEVIRDADILISGAGRSHFITENMVKENVVIFDAGTSEDSGILAGDVAPEVSKKAALFTPVPGGIGPITVAILLKNLVSLVSQ